MLSIVIPNHYSESPNGVEMLSVLTLSANILNTILLIVLMPSVTFLSVILPSVVAPLFDVLTRGLYHKIINKM
jgi:hypothetical protein